MNKRYQIKYQTPNIEAFNQLRTEAGLAIRNGKQLKMASPIRYLL